MATTIKLKSGSGAPLAGDLVAAEPAFDLTNKRLYTEDSGGTVIEVGTNPTSLTTGTFTSTGIDDNATSTAITIDSSENVGIGTASPSVPLEVNGIAKVNSYLSMNNNGYIRGDASGELRFQGGSTATTFYDSTNISEHMRIDSSGRVGIGIAPYATRKLTVFGTGAGEATVMIEGEGGADPCINFLANNTQHWTLGIDDSDADKFKLSEHSALGTNDYLVVDTSGNVGIGTTSPSLPLEVHGVIESNAATNGVRVRRGSTGYYGEISVDYVSSKVETYIDSIAGPSFSGEHVFRSSIGGGAVTERMRIDSSGNVGIGTSSPWSDAKLTIDNGGSGSVSMALSRSGSGQNDVALVNDAGEFIVKNGVASTVAGLTERMRIDGAGRVCIGTTSGTELLNVAAGSGSGAGVEFAGNGNTIGSTSMTFAQGSANDGYVWNRANSTILFGTNNTESMRLTAAGQLILTVSKDDTTSDAANMNIRSSDGLVRRSTSSRKYKNSITDATHGLTELLALRSVTYKGNSDGDRIFGGLIAEEVHEAGLTEFVQYDSEGNPDALAYGPMIALCVKAIQELTARVAELEGA